MGPASYQSAKGRVWGTIIERFVPMECNKPYKCNRKHVTGYIHTRDLNVVKMEACVVCRD